MAAFSKLFAEQIGPKTCQTLGIHQESCLNHCLKDIPLYLLSNFKYFAPICLLPMLIHFRSINKAKLRQTLKYYAECAVIGGGVGYSVDVLICTLRYLLGHFGYYSSFYCPTVIGGCLYNLASNKTRTLFETSIFQCNIETFLLRRRNFVSRLIADSKYLQTYIFMICSALILQGKYLYNLKGFWFLEPNPKVPEVENSEHSKCQLHPKMSCQHHLVHGMRNYFLLGFTLDIIKALMSRVNVAKDQSKFLAKIKNFRIRSMALLTAYIGIYRFTHCYLNRKYPHMKNLNHIISAFLSGFCYNLYPQSNIFSYALLRIPFARILFPFGLANMVHNVCLRPEYCSPLTFAITCGVTNDYPHVIKHEVQLIKQKIQREI
ncbi:uncharacterized protein LOC133329984 [Musca vetustissima]|uniref:uncharacterized protein LOC133329984 n=1 Tax=Musca vetustissima TaxID=27455 RepID=UPI002AB60C5E|nr:uncharacterized protein LOC133329984 [Musca vetustissima]